MLLMKQKITLEFFTLSTSTAYPFITVCWDNNYLYTARKNVGML